MSPYNIAEQKQNARPILFQVFVSEMSDNRQTDALERCSSSKTSLRKSRRIMANIRRHVEKAMRVAVSREDPMFFLLSRP